MTPELRWLSDPTVFAVNRLDAHSDHLCCRTLDEAESGLTSLRQSLDGAWRFAWSANPAARPADFWQPDADLSGFGTIRVPGHIELQGYGQLQYTNTLYPWDGRSCLRPPQVDWNDDPVGSYVKEFDLDESLRGQRVCVSFQGVEQAMYLWCNGQFVGYAEDSFTPSEFDLTPYIRDENNTSASRSTSAAAPPGSRIRTSSASRASSARSTCTQSPGSTSTTSGSRPTLPPTTPPAC